MLHVICTIFQRTEPIKILISSFLLQTCPEWDLCVVHDGPAPEPIKAYMSQFKDNPKILFVETPRVNGNYGHINRSLMLRNIRHSHKDFVLITNDDNYYVPGFVAQMLRPTKMVSSKIGMVYCDTVHSYLQYSVLKTRIEVNYIDMGSFIVRVDIAKKVGFNHIHLQADGQFAVDCLNFCKRIRLGYRYIDKPLFIHN